MNITVKETVDRINKATWEKREPWLCSANFIMFHRWHLPLADAHNTLQTSWFFLMIVHNVQDYNLCQKYCINNDPFLWRQIWIKYIFLCNFYCEVTNTAKFIRDTQFHTTCKHLIFPSNNKYDILGLVGNNPYYCMNISFILTWAWQQECEKQWLWWSWLG